MMLTRNRPEWLTKAIDCYQRQTYKHRELLILASGQDVRALVPSDDTVRYLYLGNGLRTIGAKRNLGLQQARGEIVAHFDDDDYSAPGRVLDQVRRLQAHARSVTGYRSMRFTDFRRWWLYAGKPDYALGTSLCYRRRYALANPFSPVQIGEDNEFVKRANAQGQLVTADAGDLMHATIHRNNTSPRQLSGKAWQELAAAA